MRRNSHCAPVQSTLGATSPVPHALAGRKNIKLRRGCVLTPMNASDSSRDIAAFDGSQGGEESFADTAAIGPSFTVELHQPSNLDSQASSDFLESM